MLRTGGTGAALGTIRLLADALKKHNPQFSLEIMPNLGSGGGLKALDKGAIHFALISRPLSAEEAASGFSAFEYGRTPFVLATSKKGVANLTLAQIADIYAAKRTTWADGTPIRIVLRPANDADTGALGSFSPAVKEGLALAMARDGMVTGITDQDSANDIARLAGGLGTSTLALLLSEKRPLHPIAIDGVAPSTKALAEGKYPYAKSVYIVTRGGAPEPLAKFIEFVRSAEGRRILAENGHLLPEVKAGAKVTIR